MWVRYMKTDSCNSCHQIGDKATRELEPQLGHFDTSVAAWERRLQSGQASQLMMNGIGNFDTARALKQSRRLDRPREERRTSLCKAVAPHGRRAQYRRDGMGLGHAARPICMTRSRPTAAIPPSTRTA